MNFSEMIDGSGAADELLNLIQQPVILLNNAGDITYYNPAFRSLFETKHFELHNESVVKFLDQHDGAKIDAFLNRSQHTEFSNLKKEIKVSFVLDIGCVELNIKHLSTTDNGNMVFAGLGEIVQDVSRKELSRVKASEMQLRIALESAEQAIWDTSDVTGTQYVSDNWYSMRGLSKDEADVAMGHNFLDDVHPDDHHAIKESWKTQHVGKCDVVNQQYRYRHPSNKDGDWIWILSRGRIVTRDREGHPLRIIGTDTDITDLKKIEAELKEAKTALEHECRHDALTGLANRRKLVEDQDAVFEFAAKVDETPAYAVMQIDLDHFKQVNDNYGHTAGDAVLVHVSNIFTKLVGDKGSVARMGGDEFSILLTRERRERELLKIAEQIVEEVGKPFYFEGSAMQFGASIGIASSACQGADPAQTQANADQALYEAKKSGRNCIRFFTERFIDEEEYYGT